MLRIDKAIYDADAVICKNTDRFDSSERGLLSQNILSQLRNLVEYISKKVYAQGADIDPNDDSFRFGEVFDLVDLLVVFHILRLRTINTKPVLKDIFLL